VTHARAGKGFERRPWGGFAVLEEGPGYKVKRLVVKPGHRFSYQKHGIRSEHWVVVAGAPRVIVNGRRRRLRPLDTLDIPRGAWHRAENPGRVAAVIIEVQRGSYLCEYDIVRREDDYGRAVAVAVARRPSTRSPRARRPAR